MKSNQSKYANLNLNAALTAKPGGPQGGPGGPSTNGSLTKGGLLLLSKVRGPTALHLASVVSVEEPHAIGAGGVAKIALPRSCTTSAPMTCAHA